MSEADSQWAEFHRRSLGRPVRELLRRTLGFYDVEKRGPGVAVDLGCGTGVETLELLRRGWTVHAIDTDAAGIEMLGEQVPPTHRQLLHTHVANFEAYDVPPCDLVWAGFSLPYCSATRWPRLWDRIVTALLPSGRFAGDIFGERHGWATEDGIHGTCAHCHGPNAMVEDRKINRRRLQVKYGDWMEETYLTTVTDSRPSKSVARTIAVAEAWAGECDHTVISSQPVEQPAGLEVLQRYRIAVDQHHRCPGAALDIVHADAIHLDAPARGRMRALGG